MDDQNYAVISFNFNDIWANREISVSYRFARPTMAMIKRMQAQAGKNVAAATRDLCLDTIHPDDKDAFLHDNDQYPLIATSIGGQLIKACGLVDLGN